jgi:caffeoyl-CoA O-methyltransferase
MQIKNPIDSIMIWVLPKCNSGALIIADNVLWSGKVLDQEMDKKTRALHDFNDMVRQDVRVENFIIPFRGWSEYDD